MSIEFPGERIAAAVFFLAPCGGDA